MNVYVNDFSTTVKTYYKELKDSKPLTKENEKKLFKMARNGDIKAKNKILTSNLKFVFDVTKKYKGCGVALEDLISEGNIGLVKAFDKFDESRDIKFISYAVWWIKQAIQECIKKRSVVNTFECYEDDSLNANVTTCNVSDSEDEIVYKRDIIENDKKEQDIKETNELNKKVIEKLLQKLTPRAKFIVSAYYGLGGQEEKTLDEIGEIVHLSKERVRQIKLSALKMMRSEILLTNYSDLSF